MTLHLIQSLAEFLPLKEEWNSLLSRSASHVPFLRHEYLATWWQTLGGGEWDEGELAILLVRDENHTLTGTAPFFINNRQVLFLGSYEISDYLDFIASQEDLSWVISEVFDYLSTNNFPVWDKLDLYNLPEGSPSIPHLEKTAKQKGYKLETEIIQPAPSLLLPRSWPEYLASLEARYRNEIERKIRNAESYFLPVDWYIVQDEKLLDQEMDEFLTLMANNTDKKAFLTDQMILQLKSSAKIAFNEGWLQLAFLLVGNIKAAGYLNFDFDEKIWIYNSGINSLFENISPGWVLLTRIIEWSIQNGKTELDFMRGDEAYKYQFGGLQKEILRIQISR